MRSRLASAFLVPASLGLAIAGGFAFANETVPSGNTDLRLENEVKLSVPEHLTDAAWEFLQEGDGPLIGALSAFGDDFSVTTSVEQFIDVYYDDSEFSLLRQQSGVRLRQRFVPGEATANGSRLVQVKINLDVESESTRGEVKFDVPTTATVRSKLPRLGAVIDRGDARDFLGALRPLGVDGTVLRPVLRLEQERRRVYISKGTQPFATVTLDLVTSGRFWASASFTEIEIELNEINYTAADEVLRGEMERVMHAITTAITTKFPDIEVNQTPKYNKMFERISAQIPFFKLLTWTL